MFSFCFCRKIYENFLYLPWIYRLLRGSAAAKWPGSDTKRKGNMYFCFVAISGRNLFKAGHACRRGWEWLICFSLFFVQMLLLTAKIQRILIWIFNANLHCSGANQDWPRPDPSYPLNLWTIGMMIKFVSWWMLFFFIKFTSFHKIKSLIQLGRKFCLSTSSLFGIRIWGDSIWRPSYPEA